MGGSTHSELGIFTYKSVNKYPKDLPSSILMEAYSQVEYSSQRTLAKLISIALCIFYLILFTVLWRNFIATPILHLSKMKSQFSFRGQANEPEWRPRTIASGKVVLNLHNAGAL